jgi:hypothetical protein
MFGLARERGVLLTIKRERERERERERKRGLLTMK